MAPHVRCMVSHSAAHIHTRHFSHVNTCRCHRRCVAAGLLMAPSAATSTRWPGTARCCTQGIPLAMLDPRVALPRLWGAQLRRRCRRCWCWCCWCCWCCCLLLPAGLRRVACIAACRGRGRVWDDCVGCAVCQPGRHAQCRLQGALLPVHRQVLWPQACGRLEAWLLVLLVRVRLLLRLLHWHRHGYCQRR